MVFSKSVELSLFDFSIEMTVLVRMKNGKALLEEEDKIQRKEGP